MPMVISKTTSKLTNAASDSLKATERWAAGLGPDVGALVDVGFMGFFRSGVICTKLVFGSIDRCPYTNRRRQTLLQRQELV